MEEKRELRRLSESPCFPWAKGSTHRPARKRPVLPLFLKVGQDFPVELVLVQQRLDPVRVVLQVLQQHLQVPAQATWFPQVMQFRPTGSDATQTGSWTYFLYSAFFLSLGMSKSWSNEDR